MPGYESEEDKLKTILKAQGLHPFAKMAVNIGKENLEKIVGLTRYVQALARPKSYPFLNLNKPIAFMDENALKKIMYDPLNGFVWYFQEKGEMDTFGDLVRAQGKASDVPLGTASEVAAVIETAKGKMPTVVLKKELGMDNRTSQELLSDFRQFEARGPEDHEVLEETEKDVVKRDVPKLVRFEGDGSRRQSIPTPPWGRNKKDR
jgi:hypothetical protein